MDLASSVLPVPVGPAKNSTPRGRLLSEGGYRHLGVAMPKDQKRQLDLLATDDPAEEA